MYSKKKRIIVASIALLILVVAAVTFSFATDEEPVVITDDVMSLYNELSGSEYKILNSKKYLVTDDYITRVLPDTKIDDFKKEFNIDEEHIQVFDGEEEVTVGNVKTGMVLKENGNTYTLVVVGDVSKDSKLDKTDLTQIINNTKAVELSDFIKKSSDINEDGIVDKIDVELVVKYIFNEGLEVKEVSSIESPTIEVVEGEETDGWYKENLKVKISNSNENITKTVYLIKGTKERLETVTEDKEIELSGYGAYKVIAYSYGAEGNRSEPVELVVGVDTDNKCIKYGAETLSECMLINDGDYTNTTSAIAAIKEKTVDFNNISTIDEGLLMANDEQGESFYYRGSVADNFVEFAGYTWRIIRRNGDGSVRLIYNGKSTTATAAATAIGTSKFNPDRQDAAFVGYKYGLNQEFKVTTATLTYTNIGETSVYYFADNITCSEDTKKCSLSGNVISGIWSEKYSEVLNGNEANGNVPYKYTCWATKAETSCGVASEIINTVAQGEGINPKQAKVKYHGYLSKSYADTYVDDIDSTIKTKIDTWYETNLKDTKDANGNNYSSYLVDQVFCNDRTFTNGDGHTLEKTSYYGAYNRNASKKIPSLVCPRVEDKFTVSTDKGNGELTYPVALITVDEVMMAEGKNGTTNGDFWLKTGQYYWTMSPSYFNANDSSAHVWFVTSTGNVGPHWTTNANGVRPVINLSSDVLVTGGNGTTDSPYQITLSK